MSHPSKGSLLDLADLVLMDAQFLEALRDVSRNFLQLVLGKVKPLEVDQGSKGLGMNDGDLVVYQNESLKKQEIKQHTYQLSAISGKDVD